MASLLKNVASQNVTFCLVRSADGGASTSTSTAIIVGFIAKDGTQASAGGTWSCIGAGNGQWAYSPTQAETNATDVGIFITTSGTSCIPTNLDFHTEVVDANGFKSVNLVDIAGATLDMTIAQIGVNLISIAGTTSVGAAGSVGIDWGAIQNKTTTNVLSATSISTSQVIANVTVGTNTDKTGYSLTQAFPSNFSSLAITGGGAITVGSGTVTSVSSNVAGSVNSVATAVTVGTNNDKTGYALSGAANSSVADAMLDRDMSLGSDSGSTSVRTPRQALRFLRNNWQINTGTLTVYKEDDVTASWTGSVTQSSAAFPVIGNDPAGP